MLSRQNLFLLVIGLSVINGIFSPYLKIAVPITTVLMPEMFPKSAEWVLFFASILVSSATLLFSGVPAALWEKIVERDPESRIAMWIWIAGAAVLSAPGFATIAQM